MRLVAEAANQSAGGSNAREFALFDGETYRFSLSLRHSPWPGWEVGLDLPVVSHSGGIFDSFIEGWHDFFGLPQGGRDDLPQNRLIYSYGKDGDAGFDLRNDTTGLGDIRTYLSYQLCGGATDSKRSLALRAGIKLPTGDSDRLRGSGGTDLHLRLAGTDAATLEALDLTLSASAGVLWLGQGDILPGRQRDWVGFGSAGAGWHPLEWLALKLQVDAHSSFFRGSDLEEIDSGSLQLVMGGTLFFGRDWNLDLAVTEDIVVNTAPDVVFHLALGHRF